MKRLRTKDIGSRNSSPIARLMGLVALAIAGMALAAAATSFVASAASELDYDADDDGLIEVSTLAQLNAMRWDLDGDGEPAVANATDYAAAFPSPLTATVTTTAMGCPTGDHDSDPNTPARTGCAGYELAGDLDFDEDGDGTRNDTHNTGSGWLPIGDNSDDSNATRYNATFEGNGHVIANLFINRGSTNNLGLFGHAGSSASIRNLGLTGVSVTGSFGNDNVGGLVGDNRGVVTASYATGSVSGGENVGGLVGNNDNGSTVTASYSAVSVSGSYQNAGGLVGYSNGTVAASYATGSVSGRENVGGLVGDNWRVVTASYATGSVSGSSLSAGHGGLVGRNITGAVIASYATGSVSSSGSDVGGLVGEDENGNVINSYHDGSASGRAFGIGSDDSNDDNTVDTDETNSLPGKTTAELQSPLQTDGYAGIYATWNVDIDNADSDSDSATGGDDPWDFGTSRQYPALKADFDGDGTATWQEFGPQAASPIDYDTDDDGLIEVSSLAQLNAVRYDRDGDGVSSDAGYLAAFPSHAVQGRNPGCPSGCAGYELTGDLDFDEDGDGTRNDTHNTGSGWLPIGDNSDDSNATRYNATFEGNGYAIANLFIDRDTADYVGLFGYTDSSAVIRNLGVTGASVSGNSYVGGLAGRNQGMVTASYATGSVSGSTNVGGLVGENFRGSSVTASYATGSVSGTTVVGGLVGWNNGRVTASYATSSVSGNVRVGGLVGSNSGEGTNGAITASYATGSVSGSGDVGGLVGANRGTVTNSYYDWNTSGRAFGIGADDSNDNNTIDVGETDNLPGQTTAQLRAPTAYGTGSDIYAGWNVSIDEDNAADDPWDFGTAMEYPALKVDFNGDGTATWQEFGPQPGRLTDHDADDDGLIEVDSLAQLNAMRWDLDGDGATATSNAADYAEAFGHSTEDACAYDHDGNADTPNRCVGYELTVALDFDENGDGNRNDPYNTGSGWQPIGAESAPFTATFEGNGHVIANLFIDRGDTDYVGLLGHTSSASVIRNLGLTGVSVSGASSVGGLAGRNQGRITSSYVMGSVTGLRDAGGVVGRNEGRVTASYAAGGVSSTLRAGGVVGRNEGRVTASYATGSVSSGNFAGGLVGSNYTGSSSVAASYATGSVSSRNFAGGLVGNNSGAVTNSYYDESASGRAYGIGADDSDNDNTVDDGDTNSLPGKTTAELRAPTSYGAGSRIYAGWNVSIDGDDTSDDPWDFGTATQYPALKVDFDGDGTATWQEFGEQTARFIDYDTDDDGLIEVSSLAQLDAMRWDRNAAGAPATANAADYSAAFPGRPTSMGCPSGCIGYELTGDLDFDENGDGNRNDTHNTGAGWQPIGAESAPFTAVFEGNGHAIANLFINRSSTDSVGLFGYAGSAAVIRNLGLTGSSVSGRNSVGGLVAENDGSLTASYATGTVSGGAGVGGLVGSNYAGSSVTASYAAGSVSGTNSVGGLVGWNFFGTVTASYAAGSVSASSVSDSNAGGLVGDNSGSVTNSYARGSVSGDYDAGGLVGDNSGSVTNSYYDGSASGRTFGIGSDDRNDDNTLSSGETNSLPGKTTVQLRQPTGYTGIYEDWNDLDGDDTVDAPTYWDFGTATQYPALKADFNNDGTVTWQEFGPQASGSIDYDADDDGLVEVDSLAQLDAMRWDRDGDGMATDAGYLAAYPSSHAVQGRNLGCPSGCVGYELTAGLDFDEDGDGARNDTHNTGSGWQPIGDGSTPFTAVFDGNGHVIANLFIDRGSTDHVGLWGHTSSAAVVRNLGLTDVSVSGGQYVGGLVGDNYGTVTASYAAGSVAGDVDVGGLVGWNNGSGSVTASYATGSVAGATDAYGLRGRVGGLVGYNQGSISASYATGSVIGKYQVGGLAGWNSGSIATSYATGSASSGEYDVGGLVGTNVDGKVTASYATGSVSGDEDVGGLVGRNFAGKVTASYATGSVSGDEDVGGLVGSNSTEGSSGAVTNSYYDGSASGRTFGIGADDSDNDNTVGGDETNSLPGQTTAELQSPLQTDGYAGIYATWNVDIDNADGDNDLATGGDDPWDFGLSRQYPALKADFDGNGTVTWLEFGPQAASPIDYDADDDGLIEVDSLARLNAMRYDLDGAGIASDAGYVAAYPSSHAVQGRNLGCPSGCIGYELTGDLDFDENGDGNRNDTYNTGEGWQPIGVYSNDGNDTNDPAFTAVFEGNGHVIANLFINRSSTDYVGLFGYTSSAAVIRNLGLTGVSVSGGGYVGGLAGANLGRVTASYATGSVSGLSDVGGLVGRNRGLVTASYAAGSVSGLRDVGGLAGHNRGPVTASYAAGSVSGGQNSYRVGGLVGGNYGGSVTASYATGSVSGGQNSDRVGGLVGESSGAVANSYHDGSTSGRRFGIGSDDSNDDNTVNSGETNRLPGKTTAQLHQPTGYTGIYATWNVDIDNADSDNDLATGGDDPWDFGLSRQYPALEVDFNNDGTPTWQEFGKQRAPEPVRNLSATRNVTALTVTWDPPTGVTPSSGYQYRVSQDGGETWGAWTDTANASHTINNPPAATNYAVEVRLPSDAVHGPGRASRIGPPGTPENLALTPGNQELVAAWAAPLHDGGSVITGYLVERDDGTGGSFTGAGHTGTETRTTITGLTNGQDYRARVAARNVMGASAYSAPEMTRPSALPFVSIAPGASPVTEGAAAKFTILADGALSADLVVTVAVSGSEDFGVVTETRTVTLSPEAPVAVLEVSTKGDGTAKSAADATATVQPGLQYEVGAHGSASVRINDDDSGLNAPANFRAIPGFRSVEGETENSPKVDLSWDAPPSSGSAVTGYELQESVQADFPASGHITYTKRLQASSTSYEAIKGDMDDASEDNNLHPGLSLRQTHYFRVRAFTGAEDARLSGPWSAALRVRPSEFTDADIHTSDKVHGEVDPPGPVAPVIIVPVDQALVVFWGIPSDVGGNTIVAYDLRRRQSGDSGWTPVEDAWTYGSGALSYELDYLPGGETYEVQVHADSVVTANSCAAMGDLGQGSDEANLEKCLLAKGDWSATTTVTDYDTDEDRLIEVDSLAKLNAMRWDLDGDGAVDDTTDATAVTGYAAAFPNRLAGMGCARDDDPNKPTMLAPCLGYELTAALDFDTGAAGDRTDDDYHNGGNGWNPVGDSSAPYTGEFDGRGHTIANLFINRGSANDVGLFGALWDSTVSNLRLIGVNVTGATDVGALAGQNLGVGSISGVAVAGSVSSASGVGGLVGKNKGTVAASYAAVAVSATGGGAGGLVGENEDGDIRAGYATGAVSGSGSGRGGLVGRLAGGSMTATFSTGAVSGGGANVGGLVGLASDSPTVAHSYWDTETSGRAIGVGSDDSDSTGAIDGTETETDGVTGKTTAALRGPLQTGGYAGIYADWNVSIDADSTAADPWDFGLAHNYPALKVDFNNDGTATWQEFGVQREPGPVGSLSAALDSSNNIEITWTAPTDAGSGTLGGYQYRVSTDGGATWNPDWTDTSATSHTITPAATTSYTFEVRATSGAAHSPGVVSRIATTDYDADDDGLIEVGSLAQLNAIRWDPDGDGSAANAGYADAFPFPQAGMGCPASGCTGYELTAGLDFDTDGSGGANDADDYWNGGSGWEPIMDFEATLEGNGHAIANLFIDRVDDHLAGLFGSAGPGAVIRNLTLTNVSVTGDESVAGLAGENEGSISGVSVSGSVSGEVSVGGLAGYNAGSIVAGAAGGTVTGYTGEAGGLVGYNDGTIRSSSATAAVSAPAGGVGREMGGLAGHNAGTITASHATGSVSGHSETGGLVGGNGSSGTITASYATGGVTGNASAGGMVGGNSGLVSASYATGVVSGAANAGGLVGLGTRGAVTNSYYDQETSGRAFGIGSDDLDNDNTVDEEEVTDASGRKAQETNTLPGSTTAELQKPTDYTDIYETWDDHDIDGDGSADAPWNFGTDQDYPALE